MCDRIEVEAIHLARNTHQQSSRAGADPTDRAGSGTMERVIAKETELR